MTANSNGFHNNPTTSFLSRTVTSGYTWQHADSTLDHDHSIVRTVRQYNICQACCPRLFCSSHLELSAKNSYWQRLTRNI